jgi:hypothetical protein
VRSVGPDAAKHIRNIAIIVALAVIVWLVPGGNRASLVLANLLGLALAAGVVYLGYRLYMEHRATIFGLEDRQRGILYASLALIVVAIVGFGQMWRTGGGALVWIGMVGLGCWGVWTVWRAWRAY